MPFVATHKHVRSRLTQARGLKLWLCRKWKPSSRSRLTQARGLKQGVWEITTAYKESRLTQARGLKLTALVRWLLCTRSRLTQARGLKLQLIVHAHNQCHRRASRRRVDCNSCRPRQRLSRATSLLTQARGVKHHCCRADLSSWASRLTQARGLK